VVRCMNKLAQVEADEPDDDDLVCAQRTPLPMSGRERRLVVVSLIIHVADLCLDVLVLVLFFMEDLTNFFIGSAFVVFWACAASSLYMTCGAGVERQHESSNGLDSPRGSRQRQILTFLGNLSQVQILTEAYRCLFDSDRGDFFHTLRLMEAILEAAPNSLVQLYALAAVGTISAYGTILLRISVLTSFLSVGLSFAMFEQKVQVQTSSGYIMGVAVMRTFEIASRSLTLALVAALTHPYGFWWALILDYILMVVLTMRHKSVRSSYSFFLSVPLVLMSYEPVVWRREDHVVPKDHYYVVRIVEFAVMWAMLIGRPQEDVKPNRYGMSICSWVCTLGLFLLLPCIYRIARRHELARDGMDNEEFDPVDNEERDFFSDSSGSEGRDYDSEDDDEAQQAGLLSGEAANKDFSPTMDQE